MKTQFGSKTLFKHQEVAVEWMLEREANEKGRGGMLCDEMGLGKTWSMLGLIHNAKVAHTLLFCPLAVVNQWLKAGVESGCCVWTAQDGKWVKHGGLKARGVPQLFVTNYDKLLFQPSLFQEREWHRVVCDEAHIVRNPKTRKYKELHKLVVERWWLLTATPIVNKELDLQALIHFVDRNVSRRVTLSAQVRKGLSETYVLQRSLEMVRDFIPAVPDAPTIKEHVLAFDTEAEATFYRGIQGVIKNQLERLFEGDHTNMRAVLLLLLRLRQISVHPQVYVNAKRKELGKSYTRADWNGDSTKTRVMQELMRSEKKGHGWVIFCNFHDEIEKIQEILSTESSVGAIQIYDGSLNSVERQKAINETMYHRAEASKEGDGRHTVFLVQILCGGTGLNLQHMDRVIFTSPWWTAALMDQAVGRVVRIGQQERVVIHHLRLAEEEAMNIDDFMNEKVEKKRELCKTVLNLASHITGYDDEIYETLNDAIYASGDEDDEDSFALRVESELDEDPTTV